MDKITPYTQKEAIDLIRNRETWLRGDVINIINHMKAQPKGFICNEIKIGDIVPCLGHPAIVIKIESECVHVCILTTEETYKGILFRSKSRFFQNSYLTATINVLPKDRAIENIIGIYDHKEDLQQLKESLKLYYKQLLKI